MERENSRNETQREKTNDWKGQPSSLLSLSREWMNERMRRGAEPLLSALHDDGDDDVKEYDRGEEEEEKTVCTHALGNLNGVRMFLWGNE
jgi:hypothetical protein